SSVLIQIRTGAAAADTSWRVVRDSHGHGLVAGWEFDGRTSAHAQHHLDSGLLTLDAQIEKLHHPVLPNEIFRVPDAFIGVFDGGWDEAGYRTQRFVEDVLAVPVPDKA